MYGPVSLSVRPSVRRACSLLIILQPETKKKRLANFFAVCVVRSFAFSSHWMFPRGGGGRLFTLKFRPLFFLSTLLGGFHKWRPQFVRIFLPSPPPPLHIIYILFVHKFGLYTVWGGRLRKMFCNMFSENSTGRWVLLLQLPCCPRKAGELSENILQNLFHSPDCCSNTRHINWGNYDWK